MSPYFFKGKAAMSPTAYTWGTLVLKNPSTCGTSQLTSAKTTHCELQGQDGLHAPVQCVGIATSRYYST